MCGVALLVSGVVVDWSVLGTPLASPPTVDAAARVSNLSDFDATLHRRGPDAVDKASVELSTGVQLCMHASLLQLRGDAPGVAIQRAEDGSLLCFNGEVFGGLYVAPEQNDSAVLLTALAAGADVVAVMSHVRGPWALAFFHAPTGTLWFGRDVVGRRSLLLQRNDAGFALSSTAPLTGPSLAGWEELPPALYSVQLMDTAASVFRHAWDDVELRALSAYSRRDAPAAGMRTHEEELLHWLDDAVARRVARSCCGHAQNSGASVLVLFSGGLDSCLIAALAHRHVPADEPIDLASVCFSSGASADRLAALAALSELRAAAPQRAWRLIEVNGTLEHLAQHQPHLLKLLHPCGTVMDLNIGSALWLAARGEGVCDGAPYTSAARVVLLGTGADEQAAGYSRHRTAFSRGGETALTAELEGDVRRLWLRNLGRDDRLIADCSREARFPFLDEGVMKCLAQMPLRELADLTQPPGVGDKLVLRAAARALGLHGAACRVKRAIQFGTGLGRAVNLHEHGSGSAANAKGGGKCSVRQA